MSHPLTFTKEKMLKQLAERSGKEVRWILNMRPDLSDELLLDVSINKWATNLRCATCDVGEVLLGASNCAFCYIYNYTYPCADLWKDKESMCPIYAYTRQPYCRGTPAKGAMRFYLLAGINNSAKLQQYKDILPFTEKFYRKIMIYWIEKELKFLKKHIKPYILSRRREKKNERFYHNILRNPNHYR